MYLTYKNITLRNATCEDAPQLAAWWNDGNVMAHAGFPLGLGTTAEEIAVQIAEDSEDTRQRLILLLDEERIGEMCYYNTGNQIAEIGIKICEFTHQEKGIGRIALSMLISHLFHSDYSKIILDTNLKNRRAQHVYEKLGFRRLRVNTDSWRDQLGELQSSVDYELTADTFHNFAV